MIYYQKITLNLRIGAFVLCGEIEFQSSKLNETILASCFYSSYNVGWLSNPNNYEEQKTRNVCVNAADKHLSISYNNSLDIVDDNESIMIFSSELINIRQI